jgi:peptidyl-prolyl cis-trans isomerase C
MRLRLIYCLSLLAAGLIAVFLCRADADAAAAGGRAALVNGALITAESFEGEMKRVERLSLRGKPAAAVNRKQVLENLIVRELLYQEAQRLGIKVTAEELAAKLAQLTGRLSGQAALESALDSMGLSSEALEQQLERGLVIEKYLEGHLAAGAPISGDEVEFYYQDHPDQFREPLRLRLSHILVRTDPAWDAARKEQGRQRIVALQGRLAAGEDFAALARGASDCFSAKNGGDLGYFLPGQLGKKMEDEARALGVGGVSGIVEDRYGLHLLKLTELRPAGLLPLEQATPRIRALIKEERQLKALVPVVKRLRAAAKVELVLNENE